MHSTCDDNAASECPDTCLTGQLDVSFNFDRVVFHHAPIPDGNYDTLDCFEFDMSSTSLQKAQSLVRAARYFAMNSLAIPVDVSRNKAGRLVNLDAAQDLSVLYYQL